MLNGFFIIQNKTGNLLYEKIFLQEMNNDSLEMFKDFLTTLKELIIEMKYKDSSQLNTVNLGDNCVKILNSPEINSDLVILFDKGEEKKVSKFLQPLLEIILKFKNIFLEQVHNSEQFKIFNNKINELILSNKKLFNEELIKKKDDFNSIWTQKGEISASLRENLVNMKEKLIIKLENERNFILKYSILKELKDILIKLDDKIELSKYQNELRLLTKQIEERKTKLNYYLTATKEALKDRDYKSAYSNLYSFSYKLENFAKTHVRKRYYNLAKILMHKEQIPKDYFSQVISQILIMAENIDNYFP